MSRIGKQPINIPAGVTVSVALDSVSVKGPKGELNLSLHPAVTVAQEGTTLSVKVKNEDDKHERALWGLFARLLNNLMIGVTEGFSKKLEVNGVGYKVAVSGQKLTLHLGYSHPIDFLLPDGVKAEVEKNLITLSGIDKQLVGETAAKIRKLRKPEPYKGKGIKYEDEHIMRKAGKAAAKAA